MRAQRVEKSLNLFNAAGLVEGLTKGTKVFDGVAVKVFAPNLIQLLLHFNLLTAVKAPLATLAIARQRMPLGMKASTTADYLQLEMLRPVGSHSGRVAPPEQVNDADVVIIETVLENFSTSETVVVGEDVDLLIILKK